MKNRADADIDTAILSDDQIKMTQDHKGKIESFTGRLEMGCAVPRRDGTSHKMTAVEFPRSVQLTDF
jgi:hypothetical protein